jgi:hypothetical protein
MGPVRWAFIFGFLIAYALLAIYLASQAVSPMGTIFACAGIVCLLMIFIDLLLLAGLIGFAGIMAFLVVAIMSEKYGWFGDQSNTLILVWLGMLVCGGPMIAVYMTGLKHHH